MATQSSIFSSMPCAHNSILRPSKKRIVVTNANMSLHMKADDKLTAKISTKDNGKIPIILQPCSHDTAAASATAKLYAVLEAVADRVEMHANIGEQRNNWNSLLLNSINTMTLTATAMAGLTAAAPEPVLGLKLSSAALFAAATAMLVVVNKLQPSQLAEEQRNATRLFKGLHQEIQTALTLSDHVTETDVAKAMERVLALDRAYPLPLIGVMLEKFPAELEAAVWWPPLKKGEEQEMEEEMREIVSVLREKDKQEYLKLGNAALKLNKMLAVLGPVFAGAAAVGSALLDPSSCIGGLGVGVAVGGGALATIVNIVEHGGQVGMVVEMYRNCAGSFQIMEEYIEEKGVENGELMEMKVSLQLGRSLSQLKDLAVASASCRQHGTAIDEFASKLL
ncbi:probable F-box protein At4g22030 [Salvia miltiorrhiza]|uniref:probable F-box protein At4g22030 n=1 Tax=Salvia miltiorrhiza TaxID=226208 RepID=UPI0025ACB4A9|nr:probable F-box protein At4g22030 [Salvia miltiorrhiza]